LVTDRKTQTLLALTLILEIALLFERSRYRKSLWTSRLPIAQFRVELFTVDLGFLFIHFPWLLVLLSFIGVQHMVLLFVRASSEAKLATQRAVLTQTCLFLVCASGEALFSVDNDSVRGFPSF